MRNIILCGFMGTGKSTVGKALAEKLGLAFVDMDKFIEQKAGHNVSEIFSLYGELHFRRLETGAAKELSSQAPLVIATGGGAVLKDENVISFKSNGVIVLLDTPLDVIKNRLKGDTTRPLLNRPDKDAAMASLYDLRLPLYRQAADIIIADNRSQTPQQISAEIISKIK